MLTIHCEIEGMSPISFSAPVASGKEEGETHDAHEERTWRERLHIDGDGMVFIPPLALKNCLAEAAKYKAEKIKGEGKQTYTKHFETGIMCVDPLPLGVKGEDVEGERLFVPSDGRRGGGKRVWKIFPLIREWKTAATLVLLDDVLIQKPEKVREYLELAGRLIGMGRFRPRNNGYYGRFRVTKFEVDGEV